MKRFTEKLISNFYLRNIVVCYAIFSVSIARKTLIADFNVLGFWMSAVSFTGEYLMFLFHNLVLYEKLLRRKKYVSYVLSLAALLIFFNEVFLRNVRHLFLFEWLHETPVEKMLIYYDFIATTYISLALYLGFKYFRERQHKLKIDNLARQRGRKNKSGERQRSLHGLASYKQCYTLLFYSNNTKQELLIQIYSRLSLSRYSWTMFEPLFGRFEDDY
jgi:hypothetical protein